MITIKENAPVKFLEEGETPFDELSSTCNCLGQDFCQLVHSGDNTPFQLGLSEATGIDLVSNGNFSSGSGWTLGSGWAIANSRASHSGGGGELSQTIGGLRASTYYKLTFSVSSYSNSQNLLVSLSGDAIKTLNANGTYTVYWFTDSTLTNSILKFTPHTSTTLNIDDVTLYEMSTVVYGIKDLDDQVIKTVTDGTGVTYYQTTASVEVDWSDVDEGCYRIFLIDNSNNLFTDGDNGTFETASPSDTNPTSWNVTRGTNIILDRDNTAHDGSFGCDVNLGAASPSVSLLFSGDTAISVSANRDYVIKGWVKFNSAISGPGSNFECAYLKPTTYTLAQCEQVQAAYGYRNALSLSFYGNMFFINGSWQSNTRIGISNWIPISTYFNSGSNTSIQIGLYLNGDLSNYISGFTFTIDTIELRGPIEIESECFKLGTYNCTQLLSWSNNENAYGFTYEGTTFQHELRVESKLWMPKYPKDRKEIFTDSAGNRKILTSRTKKEEKLTIQHMPEYLHDALSIGVEHDNFYIDGVKYINEENDYNPSWRKSSITAPVEVIVVESSQDLSNTY